MSKHIEPLENLDQEIDQIGLEENYMLNRMREQYPDNTQ